MSFEERKEEPTPALAIMVLMCEMPWTLVKVSRNAENFSAELEGLLKSNGTMRSLLPPATVSEVRVVVGVLGVRIVAITVVSGRRRRMDVIARPMPDEGLWLALCRQGKQKTD